MMENISVDGFNELTRLGLTAAMITALFHKIHDRQFIIELENSLTSFVDSNAESYELRPMNSYYRLLSHQVAEYHNLRHALAKTHENCVIIFKGDGFEKIHGKPLLQDLQPVGIASYVPIPNSTNNNKRYRILKRRNDETHSSKSKSNNDNYDSDTSSELEDGNPGDLDMVENDTGTQFSLEERRLEKEKRYEQRKQEIFSVPKNNGSDDLREGQETEEIEFLNDSSPQPCQYETSRYKFSNEQIGTTQENESLFRVNEHASGSGKRNRKRHSFYNDPRRNYSSNSMVHFHMPYYMYPTLPMAPTNTGQVPPQFSLMYPTPFPVDGASGYLASCMYQPVPGFGPISPKATMTPTSAAIPAVPSPYMTYPFPQHHYVPPQSTTSTYKQFSAPYRSHGSRSQKTSRNGSRTSFSKKSVEKQDYSSQDDTVECQSFTSTTMTSLTTEVEDLSHDIQKLPI